METCLVVGLNENKDLFHWMISCFVCVVLNVVSDDQTHVT